MREERRSPVARQPAMTCLLSGAILIAPFLALLYDLDAGLGVMALTLAASVELARQAQARAVPEMRQRLRVVMVVNALLALICAVILAVRLVM
ncbi:MAG: hypothetical protein ACR2LS_10215 [Thermomicrobiales bacterium]